MRANLHRRARLAHRTHGRGIGIVEILVGLTIGMIAAVSILNMLMVALQTGRTTGDAADVNASAALGLFRIERDMRSAGFGLGKLAMTAYGCTVRYTRGSQTSTFVLAPVRASFGAADAPDELHLQIGSATNTVEPVGVLSSELAKSSVKSRAGFAGGDVLLFMKPSTRECELRSLTARGAGTGEILHDGGTYRASLAFAADDQVMNLGQAPRFITYRMAPNGRGLLAVDQLTGLSIEVGEGIVDLQVQLGVDGANGRPRNNQIDDSEWVDAAGTILDADQLARVLSVRVALLAQGVHYEKEEVTAAQPTWGAGRAFRPLTGDWRHYRYRVYESTTSFSNVLWNRGGV